MNIVIFTIEKLLKNALHPPFFKEDCVLSVQSPLTTLQLGHQQVPLHDRPNVPFGHVFSHFSPYTPGEHSQSPVALKTK